MFNPLTACSSDFSRACKTVAYRQHSEGKQLLVLTPLLLLIGSVVKSYPKAQISSFYLKTSSEISAHILAEPLRAERQVSHRQDTSYLSGISSCPWGHEPTAFPRAAMLLFLSMGCLHTWPACVPPCSTDVWLHPCCTLHTHGIPNPTSSPAPVSALSG